MAPKSPTILADASRCETAVCRRVHVFEPSLPIGPPLVSSHPNPCFEVSPGRTACLPLVHVISGWHMFSDEALGWLKRSQRIEHRGGGGCFDDWSDDSGGARWAGSFGTDGGRKDGALWMTHCNKLLSWYPAFAGRYLAAWGKAYGPCKEKVMKEHPERDYYKNSMWQVCRPLALAAHDKAMGSAGSGAEATPPFVLRALYGGGPIRLISALRHPVDRLETSFWLHRHYPGKYGSTADGLHKYALEQTTAFTDCAAAHGSRRCAYLFEYIAPKYSDVFYHCDQVLTSSLTHLLNNLIT